MLDFGLAKVAASNESADLLANSPTITSPAITHAGLVLGTAAYMSPEQAKGKPVDKTADVWAFGVVVYEMLTGKQLHQGETVSETVASVLKDTPDLSRVPTRVRRLLRSCLQKDPEQRLHDIADWRLLLDDETEATTPQTSYRVRWLWASIAALLLVTLAGTAVVLVRPESPVAQELRLQIPQPEGLTFNPGTQAAISPDGRWLAFAAADANNVSRMYIRSVDSLEVRPLPGSEGIIGLSPPPFWSYDSRFVVYGAQGELRKSEITGNGAILPRWTADGKRLLYLSANSEVMAVDVNAAVSFQNSAPRRLFGGVPPTPWTVVPGGDRFLFLRPSLSEGLPRLLLWC